MSKIPGKSYCLATVASESFLPGTLLMINSFLKHHPWFRGDLVVIHDNLPEEAQLMFSAFRRVKFLRVGEEIKGRLRDLARAVPRLRLETKADRFYSLEVFRLAGYSGVIFMDSDILVLGDLHHLLAQGDTDEAVPLLCCGDHCHYRGIPRDAGTFLPLETGSGALPKQQLLTASFNSGFMIIHGSYLTGSHYRGLLELLSAVTWQTIAAPQTDQVVLNLYFRDRCRILDSRYNFLVSFADLIRQRENTRLEEIKVLHFNGRPKPWDCLGVMERVANDTSVIRLFNLWYQAFREFLPQYHLRRHCQHVQQTGFGSGQPFSKKIEKKIK
jgi:lipopolysaccharide biosynthesis glycosyltransferase